MLRHSRRLPVRAVHRGRRAQARLDAVPTKSVRCSCPMPVPRAPTRRPSASRRTSSCARSASKISRPWIGQASSSGSSLIRRAQGSSDSSPSAGKQRARTRSETRDACCRPSRRSWRRGLELGRCSQAASGSPGAVGTSTAAQAVVMKSPVPACGLTCRGTAVSPVSVRGWKLPTGAWPATSKTSTQLREASTT